MTIYITEKLARGKLFCSYVVHCMCRPPEKRGRPRTPLTDPYLIDDRFTMIVRRPRTSFKKAVATVAQPKFYFMNRN